MPAPVLGSNKRSYHNFEEESSPNNNSPSSSSSYSPVGPAFKRHRFSPVPSGFDKLKEIFPSLDHQILEKALEECSGDIYAAIKRLHELCLGSSAGVASANHEDAQTEEGAAAAIGGVSAEELSWENALPANGTEWVELFVNQMQYSKSLDEARGRVTSLLQDLEKSIRDNASAEAALKENLALKEQIQVLLRENGILKRAVHIQHERQKDYEDKNQEVQLLKQLLTQCQEQLRRSEVTNYSLSMHLQQAQRGSRIPDRFNPDVF